MLIAPILHVEAIDNADADRALLAWGHRMGPCRRPMGTLVSHGMFAHGKLCALVVTADLVAATCAGFTRQQAVELARLCAERSDLCRPMLRLWREFVFPAFGRPWAVSYQDEALHTGNIYRFDGWVHLRQHARSGTDRRSNRKGRSKTIWGWHADPAARHAVTIAAASSRAATETPGCACAPVATCLGSSLNSASGGAETLPEVLLGSTRNEQHIDMAPRRGCLATVGDGVHGPGGLVRAAGAAGQGGGAGAAAVDGGRAARAGRAAVGVGRGRGR